MDLNLLPIFTAVVEFKSMSAAARQLGTPKSTVSRAMASLEAALQVKLLHRTTRVVELTPAGRQLYERAKPLVAGLRELAGSLPEADPEPSGELRLSAPRDLALAWLPEMLSAFSARYPRVHWLVSPSERPVDLVGEGFDLSLRLAPSLADSSLVARRLGSVGGSVYGAPNYLARHGTPQGMADLPNFDWVAWTKTGPTLPRVGRVRLRSDDILFVYLAIKSEFGLGLLPTFLGQIGVERGELECCLPSWQPKTSFYVLHPYSRHVPSKVAAFCKFIVEYLKQHPLHSKD